MRVAWYIGIVSPRSVMERAPKSIELSATLFGLCALGGIERRETLPDLFFANMVGEVAIGIADRQQVRVAKLLGDDMQGNPGPDQIAGICVTQSVEHERFWQPRGGHRTSEQLSVLFAPDLAHIGQEHMILSGFSLALRQEERHALVRQEHEPCRAALERPHPDSKALFADIVNDQVPEFPDAAT